MQNLLFIIALVAFGQLLRHLRAFPRDTGQALSQFVTHISLPALVLVQVRRITWSVDIAIPVLMPWAMLIASAGLVLAASRLWKWPREVTGGLLLIVPLGNTSFLGIPMIEMFLGQEAIPYAVLYDQLGSFLALATYGSFVVATYGSGTFSLPAVARRVATFPPFLALLAAFATRQLAIPEALESALQRLADTLVPLVMVAVGFQMRLTLQRQSLGAFSYGLGVKMLIAPILALAIVMGIGATGLPAKTSILEAGMPPQVSAAAVAIAAGLAPELVASMVGVGIVLAPLTLWGVAQLIGSP